MSEEKPYTIAVPDAQLELLHKKLDLVTFPDELPDSGWKYGAPLGDIQRLTARWRHGFDWRAHEARLNAELLQFTRSIAVENHGTLNVHYVHKKSDVPNAIPLLFVHGWPGSFIEVRKILPLLLSGEGGGPAFHVVAPSLAGYGFSEAPKTQGFGAPEYAEACHKVMLALGYDEYVTQGGDWGHLVTRIIALKYGPKHSKAWQTNIIFDRTPVSPEVVATFNPIEAHMHRRVQEFQVQGDGYFKEQATAPQTLGYSLADSPTGLLAWIYEKLHGWTDDYPWEDDEVLEWVSIYLFSRAGPTASLRIYFEVYQSMITTGATVPKSSIPLGLSYFRGELGFAHPALVKETVGNLVDYTYHEKGGHFAAHEAPEALVADVRKLFVKGGPAYGVVAGKDGYA